MNLLPVIAGVTILVIIFLSVSAVMTKDIGWKVTALIWAGTLAVTGMILIAVYMIFLGMGWDF